MQKVRISRRTTANRASMQHRLSEHACVVLMQVLLTINLLLGTVLLFLAGEENLPLIVLIWVAGILALLCTEMLDRC